MVGITEQNRTAADGVCGREWSDYGNDPAVWPRSARREGPRGPPARHWNILTVLEAMSPEGMRASMTVESATDGDIFLAYLDRVLCPALRPGQVVLMDNLSAHKVPGVWERIEAAGAQLLYLPPYSPDFNPIEKAWSKIKQHLRKTKARTLDLLEQAIADALRNVSSQDASGCFSPLRIYHT
jgi:transposase